MRLAVVVVFLNEERHLPEMLESLAAQTRQPDQLVLVDDGSTDRSPAIAEAFASRRGGIELVRRDVRPAERDRLATAGELLAFQAGVQRLCDGWDVVAKLDGDLRLTPHTLDALVKALESDPGLGMVGACLSEADRHGALPRMRTRPEHVHGATSFYRRECFDAISPLPPINGWDMIDAARARLLGWRTATVAIPGGDPVHLRPIGDHAGRVQSFSRWGAAAYTLGDHPLHVLLHAIQRMSDRPLFLGGLGYLRGWLGAWTGGAPRVEPELRHFVRAEQLARIRRRARHPHRPTAPTGWHR